MVVNVACIDFLSALHCHFGTKGLSISFVSSEQDQEVLKSIEKRFEVALPDFPEGGIDASTYMAN